MTDTQPNRRIPRDVVPPHTQIGSAFIVAQPRWFVACDLCEWSTEHWDLKSAKFAAANHAEACYEAQSDD
jgi:hypothetical protein